jgi:chromosome segregation ATPase
MSTENQTPIAGGSYAEERLMERVLAYVQKNPVRMEMFMDLEEHGGNLMDKLFEDESKEYLNERESELRDSIREDFEWEKEGLEDEINELKEEISDLKDENGKLIERLEELGYSIEDL